MSWPYPRWTAGATLEHPPCSSRSLADSLILEKFSRQNLTASNILPSFSGLPRPGMKAPARGSELKGKHCESNC
jgi:hypothetical protein